MGRGAKFYNLSMYRVDLTGPADKAWGQRLKKDPVLYIQIEDALAQLAEDPLHPSLRSHRFHQMKGPQGQPIWESYVTQGGAAWRIWWCYGPDEVDPDTEKPIQVITVVAIGPHP